ncbi:MAG: hypothetical protein AAF616_13960 [Bacteroidota bacterium]
MKKQFKIIPSALLAIILIPLTWSCDDQGESPVPNDLNMDIRSSFITSSNAAVSQLRSLGFSGPMGAFYGRVYDPNSRTTITPSSMIAARTSADSTDVNYCFTETWQDDGNGNYRYVIDFGNGCNFYGYYMVGKMEEIGSYTDSTYASSTTYTQFGGSDEEGQAEWWIDGTTSYDGLWVEHTNYGGDSLEYDSAEYEDYVYYPIAAYEYTADLTQTYIEFIGAPEDSVTTGEDIYIIDYEASGSEEMDFEGYTVLKRTSNVSANTGEAYTSEVETPLFMDYSCYEDDVWIFVSGLESGTYSYKSFTGTWSINYGDGSCDNLVTVTENGESEEIDLGEEWDEWEESCDEGHDKD